MKRLIIVFVSICCLVCASFATAATITLNLNSKPAVCDTECMCDQNWVVSDVVLTVTSTIATNTLTPPTPPESPCDPNCNWQHGNSLPGFGSVIDKGLLLNPGRLIAELSEIDDPITKIEVYLEDYCCQTPTNGCSYASIYDGSQRVKIKTSYTDGGPICETGFFIFDKQNDIGNATIDKLIVSSCYGHVGEIRITTTTSSQTSSTCASTGCGTTASTCGGWGCGNTLTTCGGWGCGTTMTTCGGFGCGTTLSTCGGGWGCGTTLSTCGGGFGCGTTFSTCGGFGCGNTLTTCGGFGCGTTLSTCGGFGCGTTLSTCGGGFGCGTTFSTCGGFGCGTTFSTCGISCGSTFSTCGLGCGYTYSWCQYPTQYGTSRFRTSDTPGATPAF